MFNTLMQLLPLAAIFLVGVIFRGVGWLTEKHSSWLLRLVFYIGLPIVIFLAIVKVKLGGTLIYSALLPVVIIIVTVGISLILRRSLLRKVKPKTFASMITGAAILNISVEYPFVATSYGADGLARLAVIDCFNAIMIFSVLYALVAVLAQHKPKISSIVSHVVAAPTLWALVVGILFKLSGVHLPGQAMDIFEPAALLVSWTLIFALGIKFRFHLKNPPLFLIELVLRLGLGALIGFAFVKVFRLTGLDAEIILVASMAPMGLNSITLAEIEKLDVEFAVSSVSAGLLVGIVTIPFIIHSVHAVHW